jgi:sigma54-dependent transcription regulator
VKTREPFFYEAKLRVLFNQFRKDLPNVFPEKRNRKETIFFKNSRDYSTVTDFARLRG